jgi:hypothetical protein
MPAFARRAKARITGRLRPPTTPSSSYEKKFEQLRFLADNLQHPSLRAKKYDESQDVWQGRVNKAWRFSFSIVDDTYRIEDVTAHPK